MKKKLNIKHAIFLVIVVLLLIKLMQLTVLEDVSITDREVKKFEVSQENIISSGQEIIIKSFDEIDRVKWLNNEQLLIVGSIKGIQNKYIFDIANYELMRYKEDEHALDDYGDYTVIKEIPNIGLLSTDGKSLGVLIDRKYHEIIGDVTYDNIMRYKLSDDLSKMLFYNASKDTIVTYSFEKEFYRTIKAPINSSILGNFKDCVQISPVGGYVSIEYRNDISEESYFSIYGADSGKLYAEDVFGIQLSWAPDDSRVCYFYSKEVLQLEESTVEGMDFMGKRIGYYDVENKSIDYIATLSEDDRLISKVYWSDSMITTLTGDIDDKISIHTLLSYDFDSEIYNEWTLNLTDLDVDTKVELLNDVDAFILLLEDSKTQQVMRIEKDSKEVFSYNDIKSFDTIDESDLYYYKGQNKFITVDDQMVTVSNGKSQGFIQLDETSYYIIPNEALTQIGVWFIQSNEIKILNTN
ncbi:MAG: hypothetical protein JEZ08_21690 [Clostridiales bacterium]|nr:hypothetical protein [Clostridiales bacterium]